MGVIQNIFSNSVPYVIALKHLCCQVGGRRRGCCLQKHRTCWTLTHGAVDACVLVVAEEEALFAAALVAAHGVDTSVLASTIVQFAFIHIYRTVERLALVFIQLWKSICHVQLENSF